MIQNYKRLGKFSISIHWRHSFIAMRCRIRVTVTVRTAGLAPTPRTVPADRARAARGSPERRARQTFVLTSVWLNRASRFSFLYHFIWSKIVGIFWYETLFKCSHRKLMAYLQWRTRTRVRTLIRIPNPMATLYYAKYVHIARTRIPTPYFCIGQESDSESVQSLSPAK